MPQTEDGMGQMSFCQFENDIVFSAKVLNDPVWPDVLYFSLGKDGLFSMSS